jgi:MFS family permease
MLAFAPGVGGALSGAALWGLHLAFTQGLLATLVADSAPPELRGTAFGMFNLLTGAALLAASIIAGRLWDTAGARGTFLVGALLAVIALLGLFALPARRAPGAALRTG